MKYWSLWFVSQCMTLAFWFVAFRHYSPVNALVLGASCAAAGTTMAWLLRIKT